jgi:hypothetical protein
VNRIQYSNASNPIPLDFFGQPSIQRQRKRSKFETDVQGYLRANQTPQKPSHPPTFYAVLSTAAGTDYILRMRA